MYRYGTAERQFFSFSKKEVFRRLGCNCKFYNNLSFSSSLSFQETMCLHDPTVSPTVQPEIFGTRHTGTGKILHFEMSTKTKKLGELLF
jgi:hypothetical protein